MPTARFMISGRVQGVGYRASAREQAMRLGVSGQAINDADGNVEVIASATLQALEAFERWLRRGPPAAAVHSVQREDLPPQALQGFRIG